MQSLSPSSSFPASLHYGFYLSETRIKAKACSNKKYFPHLTCSLPAEVCVVVAVVVDFFFFLNDRALCQADLSKEEKGE